MIRFPNPPQGQPAFVKANALRLDAVAKEIRTIAQDLDNAVLQTTKTWAGTSQKMFTILAETFSSVLMGTSGVVGNLSNSLSRYSAVLDEAQTQVRLAIHRLEIATSAGTPDPATLSAIQAQVESAHATAQAAGRELESTVALLTGDRPRPAPMATGTDTNASFVSRIHASTAPVMVSSPGAGFDAQAPLLELQLRSALTALTGVAEPTPPSSGNVVVDPTVRPTTVVVDPGRRLPTFLIDPTALRAPEELRPISASALLGLGSSPGMSPHLLPLLDIRNKIQPDLGTFDTYHPPSDLDGNPLNDR